MKTILVTGSTGYLGGAILRCAQEREYAIRALCRTIPDREMFTRNVELIQGDIQDPGSLHRAMQGCQAVIHTAGLALSNPRDSNKQIQALVTGARHVLRAAFDQKVERVVYTSSFTALGPTGDAYADERWWNHDHSLRTDYARGQRAALLEVRRWIERGSDIVPLYPVFLYGPGKPIRSHLIPKLVHDYIRRTVPGILGDGHRRWTFSFVDDVAKGHLLALEHGQKGESYILGGEDASLREMFELLEELTKIKRPRRRVPLRVARWLAALNQVRARLSSNYVPALNPEMLDIFQEHWKFSSYKAITQLGYTRTPFKLGLIKTLESFGFALPGERNTML